MARREYACVPNGRVDGSGRSSRGRYLCRDRLCMHSGLQSYLLIESSQHAHVDPELGLPQPHSEFTDSLKGYCGRRFLGSLPECQAYMLDQRWKIAAGGSSLSSLSPTTCKRPCIRLQTVLRHLNHIPGHLQPGLPITTMRCLTRNWMFNLLRGPRVVILSNWLVSTKGLLMSIEILTTRRDRISTEKRTNQGSEMEEFMSFVDSSTSTCRSAQTP